MTIPAQKFREVVFQLLYSYDLGRGNEESIVDLLAKELAVSKKNVKSAQERAQLVTACLQDIDGMIAQASQSYSFERIQSVERNVLRLGVFELFFDDSIPPKVAIAEAIRLSRKFSTKESATFINAVLDSLYQSSIGKPVDHDLLARSADDLSQSEKIAHEASKNKQKDE